MCAIHCFQKLLLLFQQLCIRLKYLCLYFKMQKPFVTRPSHFAIGTRPDIIDFENIRPKCSMEVQAKMAKIKKKYISCEDFSFERRK